MDFLGDENEEKIKFQERYRISANRVNSYEHMKLFLKDENYRNRWNFWENMEFLGKYEIHFDRWCSLSMKILLRN